MVQPLRPVEKTLHHRMDVRSVSYALQKHPETFPALETKSISRIRHVAVKTFGNRRELSKFYYAYKTCLMHEVMNVAAYSDIQWMWLSR